MAACEAGQLFVARATAARRDFRLSASNAASVAHVCRQLDGIPLAIELAAARSATLGLADIATRLDDVLRLLVGGPRTAATRQQSIQGAIEWSYRLLDEHERCLFERLSVFVAGFDREAAESIDPPLARGEPVAADTATVLDRLVTKSLVAAEPLPDGRMRYRLLEPIRQFARERLVGRGDLAEARRRHATYMLRVAEVGDPDSVAPISSSGIADSSVTATICERCATTRWRPTTLRWESPWPLRWAGGGRDQIGGRRDSRGFQTR